MSTSSRAWLRLLTVPLALVAAAAAGAALACSCVRPDSAAAHLRDADLMIVARVSQVRRLPDSDGAPIGETRFAVSRTIKGETRRAWSIRHQRGDSAMCGVDFRPGRDYVILARRADGHMWTGLCSLGVFPIEEYERAARADAPAPAA